VRLESRCQILCRIFLCRIQLPDCKTQIKPMCGIALRPTMQCLFPQLKSSFTVYGVSLPSPLLAEHEYAPPMLETWPRFSFPSVPPPKVNLIPDEGVGTNSGHANDDVKPCIGTFEIKTPNRRKERLPISDTAGVEFQSEKQKSAPPTRWNAFHCRWNNRATKRVSSKAQSTPTQRRLFKTRPHRRLQPQSQPLRP
jgi:hypothetical protein